MVPETAFVTFGLDFIFESERYIDAGGSFVRSALRIFSLLCLLLPNTKLSFQMDFSGLIINRQIT